MSERLLLGDNWSVCTAGHSNSTQYPEIIRKYQDFSRLSLAQVLRLPRCGMRDQKYDPLARVPTDTDSLLYLISQYPRTPDNFIFYYILSVVVTEYSQDRTGEDGMLQFVRLSEEGMLVAAKKQFFKLVR